MKEPKFKKDDWCFFEFELFQVKETEDNRITRVTDGYFEHSGHDLSDTCFPVDMKIKVSSDESHTLYKRIREAAGNSNINYPDIHRKIVELWVDLCENQNNNNKYNEAWVNLQTFGNDMVRKLRDMKFEEIGGVKILR